MSMRDAFSNLFPSTTAKGVAGVSGVAQVFQKTPRKLKGMIPEKHMQHLKHRQSNVP